MRITCFAVAALAVLTPPLAAQSTDQTQPPPATGPASDAAVANDNTLATASARPTVTIRPEDQAAYDADLATYRAELRANRRTARADAAVSVRQERAYADAMHAWRIQVIDCKRGITAACNAPTPRPGDFM